MTKFAITLFLFSSLIYSQTINVSGTVRDSISGDVLPFANILVESVGYGTASDINGHFDLNLISGNYSFIVSYVGYQTISFQRNITDDNTILNINLLPKSILLQEVSVYSFNDDEKISTDHLALKSRHIRENPRTLPDVLRSIPALPGIAINNEFSAQYNVRGGNFDENLILINGTQVYEPYHLKVVNHASVGIFNSALIKNVHLITGGFSAKYGDRLSSVLNIDYSEGNSRKHTGAVTLSLTNLDIHSEGPITNKFTYVFGIRKSYLLYVLKLLEIRETINLDFYDIQGALTYSFSNSSKLGLKIIHAGDNFVYDPTRDFVSPPRYSTTINNQSVFVNENFVDYEDGNTKYFTNLIDLQSTFLFTNRGKLKTSVSYYEQIDKEYLYENDTFKLNAIGTTNYFYNSVRNYTYDYSLKIRTLEAATDLLIKLNPFYDMNLGFKFIRIKYNQTQILEDIYDITENINQFPDTLVYKRDIYNGISIDQNIANSHKLAGYIENTFQLSNRLIFNLGFRADYFAINQDLNLSPRISGSYNTESGYNFRAAWGYYFQSPNYRQLEFTTPSDSNTKAQKAEHFIFGIEKKFPLNFKATNNLTIKIEGYYKKYHNLISSTITGDGKINYSKLNDSKGYATGLDLHISLNLAGYFGWISYGLLFAREDLLYDSQGDFPRYTDQRHTISVIHDFDLGANWNLNLGFTFGSGFAFTPQYASYDTDNDRYLWNEGEINSEYLPSYRRLDMGINKKFLVWNLTTIVFLDVSNVLNFKNIYGYKYKYDKSGKPYREEIELWPIIPTIGITIRF